MTANTNVNLVKPEYNVDGLATFYGTAEDLVDRGGYVSTMSGQNHLVEFNVDWNDVKLGTSATALFILSYNTMIPKGAIITQANFLVTTVWDSTSSDVTLNFGLVKNDAVAGTQHTIVSATGIFAAIAKTAIDTAYASVSAFPTDSLPAATTYAGATLGTALTENDLVTCHWTNHAPTTGSGILRVYYAANAAA